MFCTQAKVRIRFLQQSHLFHRNTINGGSSALHGPRVGKYEHGRTPAAPHSIARPQQHE